MEETELQGRKWICISQWNVMVWIWNILHQTHVFGHLVPSWWCCLWSLWDILDRKGSELANTEPYGVNPRAPGRFWFRPELSPDPHRYTKLYAKFQKENNPRSPCLHCHETMSKNKYFPPLSCFLLCYLVSTTTKSSLSVTPSWTQALSAPVWGRTKSLEVLWVIFF